jgi:hypothetical protein
MTADGRLVSIAAQVESRRETRDCRSETVCSHLDGEAVGVANSTADSRTTGRTVGWPDFHFYVAHPYTDAANDPFGFSNLALLTLGWRPPPTYGPWSRRES